MAIRKAQHQEARDITREIFPESVRYVPQFAWETLREIKRRLEFGKPLKPEHVAYLIDALERITNGVRLVGDRKTKPSNIGGIVARALYLTRRPGKDTASFTSNRAIYDRVKMLRERMTLAGACAQVAGEQKVSGRKIGPDGIRKIYWAQVRIFERIREVGERQMKQLLKSRD